MSARTHSAVAGETQFAFSHGLIRDITYGQIPRSRRTEKHRLAGDWVAALAPDRASNLAEMTAHHYASALEYARLSGQPSEELSRHARGALQAAGEHASQLNAFAQAERFYADALALVPDGDAEAASLRFHLGTARFRAEGGGSADLEQAHSLLLAEGDVERAAEADVLLAELRFRQGDVDGAFGRLEAAAASLEDAPPSRPKALVLSSLSRFRAAEYEAVEAIRLGEEALAMAEQLEEDEIRAHALNNIGLARVTLGDAGGVADLERSVEISAAVGSVESIRGYLNLGTTLAHLGNLDRAYAVHADGRRAAERLGDAPASAGSLSSGCSSATGRAGGTRPPRAPRRCSPRSRCRPTTTPSSAQGRFAGGSASDAGTSKAPSRTRLAMSRSVRGPLSAGAVSGARPGGEDERSCGRRGRGVGARPRVSNPGARAPSRRQRSGRRISIRSRGARSWR